MWRPPVNRVPRWHPAEIFTRTNDDLCCYFKWSASVR